MEWDGQVTRRDSYQVLLLNPHHTEFLWLSATLAQDPAVDWRVSWSNSVAVGEDCLQRHRYDVIVWDCQFRTEDSLSFLRHMRAKSQQAAIVAVSAEATVPFARSLFQAGASDYIPKRELDRAGLTRTLVQAIFRQRTQARLVAAQEVRSSCPRSLFEDRLQQALLRAERRREKVGLLFLNLDDFKRINSSLGRQAGDYLMRLVSSRLESVLRRSDSLVRMGGDEFAVILEELDQDLGLVQVAHKIQKAFLRPFSLNQQQLTLTLSMGLVAYPDGGTSSEILLRNASQAMLAAKAEQGTSYRLYNQQMNEQACRELQLEAEFRQALRSDQLDLYYQPKVDLGSGHVIGMEALVRWQHPRLGLVGPDQFIGLAERTGLIVPMGYWVIQRACVDLKALAAQGYNELICAVNLSFRQFFDKKLTETLFRIIYNSDVDTSCLEFELTESSMMFDHDYTQRCLRELRQMGISFALDDFGTGYSSFSHLQQLPISTLKIDKSFIDGVTRSPDDAVLVRSMISLAQSLKMTVVAEGVETAEQWAFLRDQQCDQVQGNYFSAALSFEAFCELLQESREQDLELSYG